jgi:hypothetical protein
MPLICTVESSRRFGDHHTPAGGSGRVSKGPLKAIPEILKAGRANPVISVCARIPVVQYIRQAVVLHELRETELTVVVIPLGARHGPPGPMQSSPL